MKTQHMDLPEFGVYGKSEPRDHFPTRVLCLLAAAATAKHHSLGDFNSRHDWFPQSSRG